MTQYDVFNGDADGLCALQQLRLEQPLEAVPVTGVKRDIALLQRVPAQAGDSVTVLDISLDRNRPALQALLARGVRLTWFDHHFAGEVPVHALLATHLDPAPDVCSSVLVDRELGGRRRPWAVVGAYGDHLAATAQSLAAPLGYTGEQLATLRALGEAINYNAYGESEADLWVAPARLAMLLRPHADPLEFARTPLARELVARQAEDLAHAFAAVQSREEPGAVVHLLPDAPWARRVQGAFANAASEKDPARAHAVLCPTRSGAYAISVRAPLARPQGADRLCLAFPGGGGRAGAGGIDGLPAARLDEFLSALAATFRSPA